MILIKRVFIAVICSILIALFLGVFTNSLYDFISYLGILLFLYLIIGVPTTFLIDKFEDNNPKNMYLNFLINLLLYMIFGTAIGFFVGILFPSPSVFFLKMGAICSVSFYVMMKILELIIMAIDLLIRD